MIVRLDFHQDVDRFARIGVFAGRHIGHEAITGEARDHRRIVLVGREHPRTVVLIGVLDHLEQRLVLLDAVDGPRRVENLVPAMFAVGLREHHQFDIGWIALQLREPLDQIIDFVFGQCQTEIAVGLHQRGTTAAKNIDAGKRLRLVMAEQHIRSVQRFQHRLGHAVEQCRLYCLQRGR